MQSFLQYRRLGQAVRKQIGGDQEKASSISDEGWKTQQAPESCRSSTTLSNSHPIENVSRDLHSTPTNWTVRTHRSTHECTGQSLTGIHARERTTHEGKGSKVLVVDWTEDDRENPRSWSVVYRVWVTLILASISFVVGAASSTDTAILPQAAAEFDVSAVVESLAIGIYLAGYAVGAVFAGPFSETFGRNVVYISTMLMFMVFLMAAALAPNIGAQLSFRFLAGAFGATPLTCAGGSISDMWSPLEKTFAFPIFAIAGFGGPVLGPVLGSYIINLGSWRWAEWIVLIIAGVVLVLILLFQPETFAPLLLKWKAEHLRRQTGDDRYRSQLEIIPISFGARLKVALARPLAFAFEPIVLCMTLYLTVLYIVLFTFLDGYPYIFGQVYGTSQGLTNVLFTGIFVGVMLAGLLVPWVYRITKLSFVDNTFVPELRLWFAMLGAPAIPVALFWMAWTDFPHISIWSPILASVLLGFGLINIFMTAYMYIIDSYEVFAASALTFVTVTRYLVAGGMTVVGVPLYENLGPHWALTLLAGVSVLMTPIPFVLYRYGGGIRKRSKYAVVWA